ncbi:MAG: hypothetical protein M1832_000288 [Thelocarpon impressellum]|nr:MAG: hypothetical protein M1832_000288 [Thelocarpon impressellum]
MMWRSATLAVLVFLSSLATAYGSTVEFTEKCGLPWKLLRAGSDIPSRPESAFRYPYGARKGQAIEYHASWTGHEASSALGFDDSIDREYTNEGIVSWNMDFDQSAPDARRWIPTLNDTEVPVAEHFYHHDFTDATATFVRDGTWPITQLWAGDPFVGPACARMVLEMRRLQADPAPEGDDKAKMAVVVKHYGRGFPDPATGRSTDVWTYLTLQVLGHGSDMIQTLNQSCERWFGQVAGAAKVTRLVSQQNSSTTENTTSTVPTRYYQGTAGGMRAVQAADGSNFSISVDPHVDFA